MGVGNELVGRSQGTGGGGMGDPMGPKVGSKSPPVAVAAAHGMRDAEVRGSLGSLIGARFTDGSRVDDRATEVLVRGGAVRNGVATLDLLVVDMMGRVHDGELVRGDNPVCITFDFVLTRAGESHSRAA